MAPKRSARPPPPPPPPPPAASSEETASGSGSEEEEEEEEEIAHSPPPAAPKSNAPPPQKVQESEASDEDEDDEEEEEEDEEEVEDEKANHVIPSSSTKNPPPPPPPTREESETSDEEEAADDEMPQTKPAPNQEMKAKGPRRPFQRTWSTDDEVRILEVLAAHRLEHGTLPQTEVLANALAGKLDNSGCSLTDLQRKVRSLQSRYTKAAKKGAPPSNDQDRRLFDFFKNVWPSVGTTKAATKVATKAAGNGGAVREPGEIFEMYPYFVEEVRELQKAHPGLFKREFAMIDDNKARALDEKIKKQRHAQMKLHLRHHDLTKEVTKTLMDLAE